MTLREELTEYTRKTFREVWTTRRGTTVPDTGDIALRNDGVLLDAVILYADLADSTDLVERYQPEFAAEIYKTYLYCAAKIIRQMDGVITAYDGDRVMGVFVGKAKNSNAARTGLRINRAVLDVINPALKAQYPKTTYTLEQKIGVDSSEVLVARTGIRGSNDLVWVGEAANRAAKMATLSTTYATYISADVYGKLNKAAKYQNGDGSSDMWTYLGYRSAVGGVVYASNYRQWF